MCILALVTASSGAWAWPADSDWHPVLRNGVLVQDSNSDASGSRNIVSSPTRPAYFLFNDGIYLHVRMRLDEDPSGSGGQGLLKPFGWGVEFDTNLNVRDYEWLIMVDGVSQNESISLQHNTIQRVAGDPGDKAEIISVTLPLSGNFRVITADSAFNGSTDYFLDFRFPWATFKTQSGLTDASPLRIFGGSSSSANALTESGADLIGASDLTTGFSDVMTPYGTLPTTGTIRFVADLAGSGDVVEIYAEGSVFLRVDDADINFSALSKQTLSVTLTTSGGDSETLLLTETGNNTGIFTGTLTTQSANPVPANGSIQTGGGQTLTAIYIDGLAADLRQNQTRTDSLAVIALKPLLALNKSVDLANGQPGQILTYRLYIANRGDGEAVTVLISDTVPAATRYLPGSLRTGAASASYASAAPLTDSADTDGGEVNASAILFRINRLAANDGLDQSGADEQLLFFRVRVE